MAMIIHQQAAHNGNQNQMVTSHRDTANGAHLRRLRPLALLVYISFAATVTWYTVEPANTVFWEPPAMSPYISGVVG
ncbi:hypothetical protein QBC43DRAFT_286384 [Cladorrhinum sp. PSN259]|nr:hypothetical protein QBC43DRAFT_286384 [Cladorrhinum sp. PSN259]